MAIDWNDPSNSNDNHVNVLSDLGKKDTFALTMCQEDPGYDNVPTGAMKWDNSQNLLRRFESGVFNIKPISLAGGGTGATDAEGARTVLQVNKTGTGESEARTNSQNDLRYVQGSRSISTTDPLQGGGDLIENRTLSIKDASTTQKGAVQLENTLNSTSTTKALTAAQGKALKDTADSLDETVTTIGNTQLGILDFVSGFSSTSAAMGGAFTSGTVTMRRSFNTVTIYVSSSNHASSSIVTGSPSVIPSGYRPIGTVNGVVSFNGSVAAQVSISTGGTITILYRDSNFNQVSATNLATPFSISYPI